MRNKACKVMFIMLLCFILNGCIGIINELGMAKANGGNMFSPFANMQGNLWKEAQERAYNNLMDD